MTDHDVRLAVAQRAVGPGAAEALRRLSPRDVCDFLSLLRLVQGFDNRSLAAFAEAAVAVSPERASVFVEILQRTAVHAQYPELAADERFTEFWRASERAGREL